MRTWLTLLFILGLVSCTGDIGTPAGENPPEVELPSLEPMEPRVWLLTSHQYHRTIKDLFGIDVSETTSLTPSGGGHGFSNGVQDNLVQEQRAFAFMRAAQQIGEEVAFDPTRRAEVYPCDGFDDETCSRRALTSLGGRVFRRPLEMSELSTYEDLFRSARSALDGPTALSLVIETMLQSGSFLYRSEVGPSNDAARELGPYERASLLSYTLWDSMPDEELLAVAREGGLMDETSLAAQVDRMIDDPRSAEGFEQFVHGLMGLEELEHQTRSIPNWEDVRDSMEGETRQFVEYVLHGGEVDPTFAELLTAPYVFADANLAPLYDLDAIPEGWVRSEFAMPGRSGLLTQASTLVAHSLPDGPSPPRLGKLLAERILCVRVPPPPDNIPVDQEQVARARTTREFFEIATAGSECAGCHSILNPAGFGFSHFDQLGRYIDEENGVAVDATTDLSVIGGPEGVLDGMEQIGAALVQTEQVQRCFASEHLRYALGRLERRSEARLVARIQEEFIASGGDLRALRRELLLSPHLYERQMPEEAAE